MFPSLRGWIRDRGGSKIYVLAGGCSRARGPKVRFRRSCIRTGPSPPHPLRPSRLPPHEPAALRQELPLAGRHFRTFRRRQRSSQRKAPWGFDDEGALTAEINEFARNYSRYGYRKITAPGFAHCGTWVRSELPISVHHPRPIPAPPTPHTRAARRKDRGKFALPRAFSPTPVG